MVGDNNQDKGGKVKVRGSVKSEEEEAGDWRLE